MTTPRTASVHETTQPDAPREVLAGTLIAQFLAQQDHERGAEPDVTHLLAADNALAEQFSFGVFATVCGRLVRRSELLPGECPEGCECDLEFYCPRCVRQAAELSAKPRPGAAQDGSRESCSAVPWEH
ncbi:MAG: hypothetical protein ACRDRQ_01260 [Pseudonocardiaceae bacterium]